MTLAYPVVFTQTNDEKDTYLVYIPDMNGVTEGYGFADAIRMARDYIGCVLYDKGEEEYPIPSKISDIDPSASEFADAGVSIVSAVDIDVAEKPVHG